MVTLTCELDLEGCVLPEYLSINEPEKSEVVKALDRRYLTFTHRRYFPTQRRSEVEN